MRKLTLKKEHLAPIDPADLGAVVGGTFKTKYDCTESYQVCNPLSLWVCIRETPLCPTEL